MKLAALSGALWQVRQQLERLEFKFDEVRILLDANRPRWLVMVADETGTILDELVTLERRCIEHIEQISDQLEPCRDEAPTLRSVAAVAPAPWGQVLTEHRQALTNLRAEVRTMALAAEATLSTFELCEVCANEEDSLTAGVLLMAIDGLGAMTLYAGGPSDTALLR